MKNTIRFITILWLLLPGLSALGTGPNVVIFIADDQGMGDLSCYGHPTLKTPHIDRLAQEGMLFESAFLTISSCSPTRCSLLTGRYAHNTGAEDLHDPLPADQRTMARTLQGAGYYAMAMGKWHLGEAEKRHWHTVVECAGSDTGHSAVKLLRERDKDKPFFFWVASKDPHRPYGQDNIENQYGSDDVIVPPFLPDHPLIREDIACYYNEIVRFDRHVGQVLDELSRQTILNDTFVLYVSDNGMPFPRAKTTLYDSGIRTPLLVRYPALARPGTIQRSLVSTIDIAPTVLELAGLTSSTVQGRSLRPLLRDPQASGREAIFAEANWHDFEKFTRAVRTHDFLLIRNYYWDKPLWNSVDSINSRTWAGYLQMQQQGKLTDAQTFLFKEPRPFEEFYDLRTDPHSLKNVAHSPTYEKQINELRVRLDNWRVDTHDRMPDHRRRDGWTRDGRPLPHNQPWYDRYIEAQGKSNFETF